MDKIIITRTEMDKHVNEVSYTQYSFQENVSTNMLEVLENGLVTHEIPMHLIKFFKYGLESFLKYPAYRRRVKNVSGIKTSYHETIIKS